MEPACGQNVYVESVVTRAENIGLHNRAIFNDLVSGKVSPYPEKSGFEFFNRIGTMLPLCLAG